MGSAAVDISMMPPPPGVPDISDMPPPPSPLSDEEEALNTQIAGEVGGGEAGAHYLTGATSGLVAGAAGALTGDMDRSRRWAEAATYLPRSEGGQGAVEAIDSGLSAANKATSLSPEQQAKMPPSME